MLGLSAYVSNLINIFTVFTALFPVALCESDRNMFIARKWCSWSAWSACSPAKCQHGIRKYLTSDNDEEDEEEKPKFCVLPINKKSRMRQKAFVQLLTGGRLRTLVTEKQRYRECQCRSVSFFNVFSLSRQCIIGDTMFECAECTSDERIYYNRDGNDVNLIPFCSNEEPGLKMYKILGGVFGTVFIGGLFLCLFRTFLKHLWLVNRSNQRSATGRQSQLPNTRLHARSDEHRNEECVEMDQPPAYTDAVTLPNYVNVTANPCNFIQDPTSRNSNATGPVYYDKPVKPQTHRFACSIYDSEQLDDTASSSRKDLRIPADDIPPPSYEEVMKVIAQTPDKSKDDQSPVA